MADSTYHPIDTPKPTPVQPDATLPTTNATKTHFVWVCAHWFVGLCLLLATWTPFMYFMPFYSSEVSPRIVVWWGGDPKVRGSGRSEMVQPTVFFLGMVVPVVVGALLFAIVRAKSPIVVPSFSHLLHRKPLLLRGLVSYGELLFLLVVLGGNVIVFYNRWHRRYRPGKSTKLNILSIIAINFGFNGLYNMAFLALPATRHCFWMEWLNIPYAHGVKYHRWLGVVTIVMLTGHTIFYFIVYGIRNSLHEFLPCYNCNVAKEGFDHWMNFFGILSFLAMVIMGITSLPFIRRKYYNVFYMTHFLFIPATIFAVLHWGPILYWLFATIVLYLVNRMFSSASISAPVTIERAIAMPAEVAELTLHCATGYSPGDVVWLKVPALSKTQWHPFSVASTPLQAPGLLTVYIKCLGPWSNQLYHYIRHCQTTGIPPVVFMDGGYTTAAPISPAYSDVVFVGGGVGVTPLMGQLMHILYTHPEQTVWLIWHVRRSEMLTQFQSWLHDMQALSAANGCRVHVRLHVTQEHTSALNVAEEDVCLDGLMTFAPVVAVEPRPYAHLSTTKRMWMLFLAFACSGGLLAAVKYGNKIQAINPGWWPLQRFVECCVVIAGSYMAYIVTYVAKTPAAVPAVETDKVAQPVKVMDTVTFVKHFDVQFQRAVWRDVFAEIEANATTGRNVGVYVSGPKALIRAVDAEIQGKSKFHVHNEEFDM
ncbi:hypothetical protein AaE_013076 [Aphanomyces astaci]|uniref:FAD-binding FR-type domain-containing protein n=1 Tax=Aphanomyces astaci TaxID=112090 RepID=A0A6A4ZC57_APHAT|nr:hypothetical protein AaE_013076 [Aphanomyces astaci]